jgi:hypothetical protein
MNRFDTVFSGDFLLRDACDSEHATAGGKRWTEGFRGRQIGHNSQGWPVFAVTSEVAPMLAHWSQEHRTVYFGQCRTWQPDDEHARRASESMTAIYKWDGCYLRSSWRNQITGQPYHGMAMQLPDGWHVVDGHSWMVVEPELIDVIHGGPRDVQPPLRLNLRPADINALAGLADGAELTWLAEDGTPVKARRTGGKP